MTRLDIDFDFCGLLRIGLRNAATEDIEALHAQIGCPTVTRGRPTDVELRFVEAWPAFVLRRQLTTRAAWMHGGLLVLHSRRGRRVAIPFPDLGRRCTLTCTHGTGSYPLLRELLNVAVLGHGGLPLHATACRYTRGIAATGLTEAVNVAALLALLAHGADYVASTWAYLESSGQTLRATPEPIRVRAWHLRQSPRLRHLLSWSERARLLGLGAVAPWTGAPPGRGRGQRAAAYIDIEPRRLQRDLPPVTASTLERLVWLQSSALRGVRFRAMPLAEAVTRLHASLLREYAPLRSFHASYRETFRRHSNPSLERLQQTQLGALRRLLRGKELVRIRSPAQVRLGVLFQAVTSVVGPT